MASKLIISLLKIFIYYLILFALCRFIFLLYFSGEIIGEGISVLFVPLAKALPLDVSTACYLLFLPLIFLFAGLFFARWLFEGLLKAYLLFTSLFCIILAIVEIGIYREIHVKLYFNQLMHLQHPGELFYSVSFGLLFTILFLVTLLGYASSKAIKRMFTGAQQNAKTSLAGGLKAVIVFITVAVLLVIGCRGGLQPIPINEGEVYFAHNQCVNDATVNPLWNIVHSFIENTRALHGNIYKVMSDHEAENIVHDLFSVEKDTTVHILKCRKPNVCILILESWSAQLIASLGGYTGITPNFEKLITEGYLFTNIKPAGHVSDQGIPAILSGYPALPIGSAINQPERQVKLPCMNNDFHQAGYFSSFYFGGQLIYGNIKSYIYRNQFNEVIEQQDLPSSLPAGRLGIHDSIMLSIWLDSLKQIQQPFFSCLFTLSTHSPFDAPSAHPIDSAGMYNAYLNSAVYADHQLGLFFEAIKKEPWYDSTIFILVADHSHETPKNYEYDSPDFYHIPLLIWGGALKEEYRGIKNNRLGSQTDIVSTLFHQIGMNSNEYLWSKNLLNPYTQPFAFYTFDEGFGYVDSSNVVIWNHKFPYLSMNDAKTQAEKDLRLKQGSAILQVLMNDFLSK